MLNPDGNLSSKNARAWKSFRGTQTWPEGSTAEAQSLTAGAEVTAPRVNGPLWASDSCLEHEDSNSIYHMKHTENSARHTVSTALKHKHKKVDQHILVIQRKGELSWVCS